MPVAFEDGGGGLVVHRRPGEHADVGLVVSGCEGGGRWRGRWWGGGGGCHGLLGGGLWDVGDVGSGGPGGVVGCRGGVVAQERCRSRMPVAVEGGGGGLGVHRRPGEHADVGLVVSGCDGEVAGGLVDGGGGGGHGEGRAGAACGEGGGHGEVTPRAWFGMGEVEHQLIDGSAAEGREGGEIGRASCGERVCQYG